jgi:hypothetical protein
MRMVAMRMGDDGPADRLPGIDVELARRAIETAVRRFDQRILSHAFILPSEFGGCSKRPSS